jgi:alpha-tubulin suppressor-like RCC1 family protein
MTIQNTTIRKAGPSQGNGFNTVFPFTFKVFTATDILVTYLNALGAESVLVLSTNYTVSLNADQNTSPGGSVTLLVAPATATYITLTSQVTNTQTLALTNSGGFYPESINDALDRIVIQVQQLAEQLIRSPKIPVSGAGTVSSPDIVLGIDDLGAVIFKSLASIAGISVSIFIKPLLGKTTLADAQAYLGIVPASTSGSSLDNNSLPLSKISRGPAGLVIAGNNSGADSTYQAILSLIANNAITKTLLALKTVDRTILSDSSTSKIAALPSRQAAELQYAGMMVKMNDGSLLAWGRAITGQLGLNHSDDINSLPRKPVFNVPVPVGVTVADFIVITGCTYVLLTNGWVYATGLNAQGQLGVGDTANRNILTRIEYFVTNTISINKIFACGSSYGTAASAFFVTSAGVVYATGYNNNGQLGIGTTVNNTTPSLISGSITGVIDITVSDAVACSVFLRTSGGQLYAAGYNGQGQLGLGDLVNRTSFTLVSSLANVAKVSCTFCSNGTTSLGHSLALLTNGNVYAAGYNGYGQLGINSTTNNSAFTQVSTIANIASIGVGGGLFGFSYAVSTSGTLYVWGYNGQGVCGTGNIANQLVPFSLSAAGFNGIIAQVEPSATSTGGQQSITVLDTNGKLWFAGWDYNYFVTDVAFLVPIYTAYRSIALDSASEKITSIRWHGFSNLYRMFVLSDDQKLYCVGDNSSGVAQGGYNPAVPAIVRSLQKIPL